CRQVLAGGREAVGDLIALLRDPAEQGPRDFKPGYLLHCLVLHVGTAGREEERRLVAEAIASRLGGEKPSKNVQASLVRELQACGGKESAEALGKLLLDDDLCDPAAQALVAIRDGAAPQLRAAFAKARGRSRTAIAQALGALSDAESASALLEAAADPDRETRIAACWALARIGGAGAAEALERSSAAEDGWERIQGAKACLLLAERLCAAGKRVEARALYTHLRDAAKAPAGAYLQEAVERGLAAAGRES
ncbi:MAG: HEAT repeat domain-containing protein, partial [Planctomycetes bacterium]|nr:HEAT repeat domain-containing protein [Planctomycetota bacterium]